MNVCDCEIYEVCPSCVGDEEFDRILEQGKLLARQTVERLKEKRFNEMKSLAETMSEDN